MGKFRPRAPTAANSASQATPGSGFIPDVELALTALRDEISLLPGKSTAVWRYRAEALRGDPAAVQPVEDSYLGPILRLRRSQKVRVQFRNELPEESIVHWHGMLVPDLMDGHPRTEIKPGETYTYEYEVRNRAGLYWFHPHPHGLTGGSGVSRPGRPVDRL